MSRRLIVSGASHPREFVLVGTMIVGRDPACDISDAADPLLSRRHAEFSNAKEATVRDLSSRNGILVNGVKTPQAVLRPGDVVQIGHLQVKFVDEIGPFMDVPGVTPEAAQPIGASDPSASTDASLASDAATVLVAPVDRPTITPDLDVTRKVRS
jgi:pSer/pThr/pTyr-binding forkhead associated (FHA) protein